jgi:hypothetical protein
MIKDKCRWEQKDNIIKLLSKDGEVLIVFHHNNLNNSYDIYSGELNFIFTGNRYYIKGTILEAKKEIENKIDNWIVYNLI